MNPNICQLGFRLPMLPRPLTTAGRSLIQSAACCWSHEGHGSLQPPGLVSSFRPPDSASTDEGQIHSLSFTVTQGQCGCAISASQAGVRSAHCPPGSCPLVSDPARDKRSAHQTVPIRGLQTGQHTGSDSSLGSIAAWAFLFISGYSHGQQRPVGLGRFKTSLISRVPPITETLQIFQVG